MPLTPATRDCLKGFYNSLADRPLEPGDPVYVAQVNESSASGASAVDQIATQVEWQEGGGVCLFTGQRGTGKSTELLRLKQKLEDVGATVFYADLAEYLLLSKEVEISDFLVSIAGALSEELSARYGGRSPGDRSYWERFKGFLGSRVEFEGATVKLANVDIKASLRTDPDFKKQVQEKARGHVAQLVSEAHGFIVDAVAFVRAQENDPERKVVLLLDSIERIRGVGSESMKVYESVRDLFFGQGESLRLPALHVVYTIPPYLSVLAAGAGHLMGGAITHRLVSTHIFKDRSRQPDEAGLALLRRVVQARFHQWSQIFTTEALDRLALSSGGDLREFFRLIKLCLPAVRDDGQLPLPAQAVAHAENSARNEMLPIPADHLDWLKRISATHQTCLAKDADLPTLAHFLDNRLVLNYRNGSDWYDVHPLLRDVIDAHQPATAA